MSGTLALLARLRQTAPPRIRRRFPRRRLLHALVTRWGLGADVPSYVLGAELDETSQSFPELDETSDPVAELEAGVGQVASALQAAEQAGEDPGLWAWAKAKAAAGAAAAGAAAGELYAWAAEQASDVYSAPGRAYDWTKAELADLSRAGEEVAVRAAAAAKTMATDLGDAWRELLLGFQPEDVARNVRYFAIGAALFVLVWAILPGPSAAIASVGRGYGAGLAGLGTGLGKTGPLLLRSAV